MKVGVEAIGDLIRTFPDKMKKHTAIILKFFIESLNDSSLHKTLRPAIFTAIGDIAISSPQEVKSQIDNIFALYVMAFDAVLHFYKTEPDEAGIEFANALKDSVVWSLSCMNHGLFSNSSVADLNVYTKLVECMPFFNLFVATITEDSFSPSEVG